MSESSGRATLDLTSSEKESFRKIARHYSRDMTNQLRHYIKTETERLDRDYGEDKW